MLYESTLRALATRDFSGRHENGAVRCVQCSKMRGDRSRFFHVPTRPNARRLAARARRRRKRHGSRPLAANLVNQSDLLARLLGNICRNTVRFDIIFALVQTMRQSPRLLCGDTQIAAAKQCDNALRPSVGQTLRVQIGLKTQLARRLESRFARLRRNITLAVQSA